MAEQRVVLSAMARRLHLQAVDPEPERAQHRNVTMIPSGEPGHHPLAPSLSVSRQPIQVGWIRQDDR